MRDEISVETPNRGFICPSGSHMQFYSVKWGWLEYTIRDLNGTDRMRLIDRDSFPHTVCLLLLAGF